MRVGVISDVHSNAIALREVVSTLEEKRCDYYILTGDYVSDTPYTEETMEFLHDFLNSHKCFVLRGNREEYMLNQREARRNNNVSEFWLRNSASGNLLYTYERLKDRDWELFERLPITMKVSIEGFPDIICAHGSPDNARELLELWENRVYSWLDRIDTDYLLCAHTHFPGEIYYNGKHYFNSGSIGIAINDFGFAQCMILDGMVENGRAFWKPTFLKIPYDYRKVVEDFFESGLAEAGYWFSNSNILTLMTGKDLSFGLVDLAAELCRNDYSEEYKWPNIPEECFQRAAQIIGIPDYIMDGIE